MAENGMRDIKRRIKSVTSTEHITKAMGLVSSSKLRKAKNKLEKTKEHFHIVTESIEEVFHNATNIESDYLEGRRQTKKRGYIIISSCRGLCGGFNANVIKEALKSVGTADDSIIFAVGLKGKNYFQRNGYDIAAEYIGPPENISFLDTKIISNPIIDLYDTGGIDELYLIYTSYKNTMSQVPITEKLLPFKPRDNAENYQFDKIIDYEPSMEEIFNYLVPKYVEIMIFKAIAESVVCEHAARRISMDNATDNAQEILEQLSLNYNRARQGAITQEISEIVGGAEALR